MREYDKLIDWFGFTDCPAWAVSVTRTEDNRVWYWDVEVNRLIDLLIDLRSMDDSVIPQVHGLGIRCERSQFYYCGPDSDPDKLDRPAPERVPEESESAEEEENPIDRGLADVFIGAINRRMLSGTLDSLVSLADEVFPASGDNVNHPRHYTSHPSGVECADIAEHHDFCVGNAIKYLWRAGLKQDAGMSAIDKEIQDLQKAKWYIDRKIALLSKSKEN